jgi:hypothetical protein
MNKLLRAVVFRDHGAFIGSWDPDAGGPDEEGRMHLVPATQALEWYTNEKKARALYEAIMSAFLLTTPACTTPEFRWDSMALVSSGEAQVLAEQHGLRVVRHG